MGSGDSPCTPRGEFAVAVGVAISCLPASSLRMRGFGERNCWRCEEDHQCCGDGDGDEDGLT